MRFLQRDLFNSKDMDEWFIYIELESKNRIRGYRFSSVGNIKLNYIDWPEDDYISDEVREVLLQYKKDKADGKVEAVPLRSLRK